MFIILNLNVNHRPRGEMTEDDTYRRLVRPTMLEMAEIYQGSFDHSGLSEISREDFFKHYHWDYHKWGDEYLAYILRKLR